MRRKVLIVEDNGMSRKTLRAILDEEYDIEEAENGKEALDILEREYSQISAVLLDLEMPKMNGFEVMGIMQKNPEMAKIPIIITTITDDNLVEGEALELGAVDYVTKPYNPRILKNRLRNTIKLSEQAASINANKMDALTGLYCRSAFFELVKEMVNAKEPGYYVMACYNINGFKIVNDQYGNTKGDAIICEIATIFKDYFEKEGGIASRIMDDRFAFLYPVSLMNSKKLNKVREKTSVLDGSILPLSYSVGRFVIDDISLEPSVMYDRAVMAKDSVKGSFDNHVTDFEESMRSRLLREQKMISEMKQALLNHQFEVWYQPQVNHESGALVGAEALVRWNHPEEGLLLPDEFVPIFEKNGFIYEMDKYVLEQACIFQKERKDSGKELIPISVNISKFDLFHNDLVEYVDRMVRGYRLSADMICLEVTESAYDLCGERLKQVINNFHNNGYIVEIDNYGTGASSLRVLRDIPADIVKIDMKFLEGESNEVRGGNILESIVRMMRWLGISVMAEGVSDSNKADFLKSIGCNYIQGFLYQHPLPKKDFIRLLDHHKKLEVISSIDKLPTYNSETFWNDNSLETLIFNSFVGGACVFEYQNGKVDIIRCNEEYSRVVFGEESKGRDVLRMNWYTYMLPDMKKRIVKVINEAIQSGKEIEDQLDLCGVRKPGQMVHLFCKMRIIAQTNDRYLFYCRLIDVTEHSETLLREEQLKMQMEIILRDMYGGVVAYLCNEDGSKDILFANETFFQQRGYTRRQYEKEIKNSREIVYPDDLPLFDNDDNLCRTVGYNNILSYRIVNRDGNVIWMQSRTSVTQISGYEVPIQIVISLDITAEKKVKEKESETELLLNTIFYSVSSGITALVLNGRKVEYIYSNAQFYNMLKYNKEEFDRKSEDIFTFIHSDDKDWVYEVISRLNPGDDPVTIEYRAVCRDNSIKNVRTKIVSIIFGEMEKVIQVSISDDITEECRENEREKELMENLPCGAGIFDLSGSLLTLKFLNKKYWQLVGREPSSEYTDRVMDAVKFDDRAYLLMMLQRVIVNDKEQEFELHLLNGDGGYSPFLIRVNVMKKKSGVTTLYATYTSIAEDAITFRRMLPVALSAMMSSSNEPAYIKDRTLSYVCASRAFAQMMGLQHENDVIGKSDFDLFDENMAVQHRKEDEKLIKEGKSLVEYIEHMPMKNGLDRVFSTSKYILKDTTGNIIGIYGIARDITEDREAYKRLSLLTDNIPGGLATFELKPNSVKTLFATEGVYRILGYEVGDSKLNNVNPLKHVVAEDQIEILRQVRRIYEEAIPMDCNYRVIQKNGNFRWVNLRGAIAERSEDRMTLNTVLFDVDEQKKNNDRISQLESDNRKRYEKELSIRKGLIRDCLFHYQVNLKTGIIEEYETKKKKMVDIESKMNLDIYLRNYVLHKIIPEDVPKVCETMSLDGLKQAMDNGDKISICYRRKLEDESYHWVKMTALFMMNPNGEEEIAFLYCSDVDQKLRTDRSIGTILDEDIESLIYVNVKNAIATVAHIIDDCRYQHVNNEFILEEECKRWGELVLEEYKEAYHSFFHIPLMVKKLEKEKSISLIYQIKEDEKVRRKVAKAYYLDSNKDYIVITKRDITIMYEEEAKQKQLLCEAVEKANKANKAKSDFLAHMSHDLRTPMNAVLAFSGKDLIEEANEAKLREYMEKVNKSGMYLLGIINDVLDMSKIEQNQIVLNPEEYTVEEFENFVHNVLDEMCNEKKITFRMDTTKVKREGIMVDHVRFNQIFINLLSNAVKYTPKNGKVEFLIEDIGEESKDSDHQNIRVLKLVVKDNGIGMTPEFVPHAFDNFCQEYRKDVKEKVEGTGLGLSIVKELVVLMGGTIDLTSELNVGTTFTVVIPFDKGKNISNPVVEVPINYSILKDARILIVEDYELNYEIVERLLSKYGSIIEWAENGEIACEIIKNSEIGYYQMILMDVRMPVMNGVEATKIIRSMDREDMKSIPIIAMTADAFVEDEKNATQAGMNEQITKPIVPKMLYRTCCKFLEPKE